MNCRDKLSKYLELSIKSRKWQWALDRTQISTCPLRKDFSKPNYHYKKACRYSNSHLFTINYASNLFFDN